MVMYTMLKAACAKLILPRGEQWKYATFKRPRKNMLPSANGAYVPFNKRNLPHFAEECQTQRLLYYIHPSQNVITP